ncbi:MAG: hypothetical protein H0Z33_16675 [Bacillaceae bacterium]|nr:hypothetical protein [Bacillaceae bacterium]
MANQWIKIGNVSGGGQYIGLLAKEDDLTIEKDASGEYYIHSVHPIEVKDAKIAPSGSITLPLKPEDGLDELLYAFFGEVLTTDNLDGTYTHTLTVKEDNIPEFEVVKNIGGTQEKYSGCKVKSVEITANASGEFDVSVEVVAKNGELVSGEGEGTYTLSKTMKVTSSSITWGGTTYGVGSATITLERDLAEDGFYINSDAGRSVIPEGNFKATAKLDVLVDSTTFLQDFLAGTSKALVITFQNADGASLVIHLPAAVVLSRAKATDVGKQLLVEEVEVLGVDDGVNGSAYAELTNTITEYPRT